MKKSIFGVIVTLGAIFLGSSTRALSCAFPLPTFEGMVEDGPIVFRGQVQSASFLANSSEDEYCSSIGGEASRIGTYTYEFSVNEPMSGEVSDTMMLTRTVDGINCTRGGHCDDIAAGEEYVVITDESMTIGSGLCGPCPYMLASDYDEMIGEEEEENTCICTLEYAPECGMDGETYGNSCSRECANVELDYIGECGNDAWHAQPGLSSTCTSWYDGCNICTVEDGILGACTERACIQQDESYCLQHTFTLVTAFDLMIIDKAVDTYLGDLSDDEKNEKRQEVMVRIQEKRDSIMDILSRSTFVVGSPELRKYTIMLEVLDALEVAVRVY